jgi:hypothetical protein
MMASCRQTRNQNRQLQKVADCKFLKEEEDERLGRFNRSLVPPARSAPLKAARKVAPKAQPSK